MMGLRAIAFATVCATFGAACALGVSPSDLTSYDTPSQNLPDASMAETPPTASGGPKLPAPAPSLPDASLPADAGGSEAGSDGASPDAGPPDAGPPDAGPPDAGPPDAAPDANISC